MDVISTTYSNHPLEILKYYYPNSLAGQENSAEHLAAHEPSVHQSIERPDGILTCTCGLVYTLSEDSFSAFGHRNHQTGTPEPVALVTDEYFHPAKGHKTLTAYRCEYCGSDEISDPRFFVFNQLRKTGERIHDCPTNRFPLAKQEFTYYCAQFPRARNIFFTPNPDSELFYAIGDVCLRINESGATISSNSVYVGAGLRQLLSDRSMLVSETNEIFQARLEDHEIGVGPFYQKRNVDEEFAFDELAQATSEFWLRQEPRWTYFSDPNSPDDRKGQVLFAPSNWRSHLGQSNLYGPKKKFNGSLVKYVMTATHLEMYSDIHALPIVRVPVIWPN